MGKKKFVWWNFAGWKLIGINHGRNTPSARQSHITLNITTRVILYLLRRYTINYDFFSCNKIWCIHYLFGFWRKSSVVWLVGNTVYIENGSWNGTREVCVVDFKTTCLVYYHLYRFWRIPECVIKLEKKRKKMKNLRNKKFTRLET